MKQEEKSLLSKGKIIDAAMKLFLEKGYENTTMQDIVEASGMSKGAIYHYFKSKQEIVAYLSDYEKEQFTSRIKELVVHPGMTAQQKIRQIVAYLFSNDTLSTLTKEKWAEKVPFALDCKYPKELAGVLILLVDIWLDPIIVESDYQEMCEKVDFIALLAAKFDTPVFNSELTAQVKEGLRRYYE